jgi:hypothetical protein
LRSEEDKQCDLEIERCTTLKSDVIKKNYVVKDLEKEVDYLNTLLPENQQVLDVPSLKDDLIDEIIKLRVLVMASNPEWAAGRLSENEELLAARMEAAANEIPRRVERELNAHRKFLSLEGTAALAESIQKNVFTFQCTTRSEDGEQSSGIEIDDSAPVQGRPTMGASLLTGMF